MPGSEKDTLMFLNKYNHFWACMESQYGCDQIEGPLDNSCYVAFLFLGHADLYKMHYFPKLEVEVPVPRAVYLGLDRTAVKLT